MNESENIPGLPQGNSATYEQTFGGVNAWGERGPAAVPQESLPPGAYMDPGPRQAMPDQRVLTGQYLAPTLPPGSIPLGLASASPTPSWWARPTTWIGGAAAVAALGYVWYRFWGPGSERY